MESFELQRRRAVCAAARASSTRRSKSGCAHSLTRLANVPAYYAAAKANVASSDASSTRSSRSSRIAAPSTCSAQSSSRRSAASGLTRCRARDVRAAAAPRHASPIEDYVGWLEALAAQLASGAVPARSFRLGRELYDAEIRVRHPVGRHGRGARTSAPSPSKRRLTRAHVAARGPAVAEVLSRRCGTGRRARQDRPRHRAAGRRSTCRASELRARRSNGRSPSSSAGCASTT